MAAHSTPQIDDEEDEDDASFAVEDESDEDEYESDDGEEAEDDADDSGADDSDLDDGADEDLEARRPPQFRDRRGRESA